MKIRKTIDFLLKMTIITALIFWSGIGSATAGTPLSASGHDFLRIFYSGSLVGNIEPCG